MNGKRAKALRKGAKLLELDTNVIYAKLGRPASWGSLPKKKNSNEIDKKLLSKLLEKTINPKFKVFGGETYLRYALGITREMGECQRSFYQALKLDYKASLA